MDGGLDLGHGHALLYVSWAPDRDLNPQHAHLPDVERIGAILAHPLADGSTCEGSLTFDDAVARELFPDRPRWTLSLGSGEDYDRPTLSPSVLCRAHGDHGFVQDGRWVPA